MHLKAGQDLFLTIHWSAIPGGAMIRTLFFTLAIAISWPVYAEIDSVRFQGLTFPLSPTWSNLTVIDSGFGLRIDDAERPTGSGTLSAMVLEPQEYLVELEDGSQLSLVTLLTEHLANGRPQELATTTDSPRKDAIAESFQSASRVKHDALTVYVEDEPFLPNTFKAYILRENKAPIEISATMKLDEFKDYLKSIHATLKP